MNGTLNATHHRVYTEEERKILDVFKDKYKNATSAGERKMIAQLEMLPALFNYWKSEGQICDEIETKRKSIVCSFILFSFHPD